MRTALIVSLALVVSALTGCKKNQTDPQPPNEIRQPAPSEPRTGNVDTIGVITPDGMAEPDPMPVPRTPRVEPDPVGPVTQPPLSPTPPPAEPQLPAVYAVQKGDTLWNIAAKFYGDGQKWRDIVEANPGIDPKKLAVGQKIVIPKD